MSTRKVTEIKPSAPPADTIDSTCIRYRPHLSSLSDKASLFKWFYFPYTCTCTLKVL